MALAVAVLTIRQALAPLHRLSAEVHAVAPGDDTRLDERAVPGEVLPLVRAVNRAFDRLHDGFAQQRRFTADAAHELRTPLAANPCPARGAARDPDKAALERSVARMRRLIDQLLAVARLESGQVSHRGRGRSQPCGA